MIQIMHRRVKEAAVRGRACWVGVTAPALPWAVGLSLCCSRVGRALPPLRAQEGMSWGTAPAEPGGAETGESLWVTLPLIHSHTANTAKAHKGGVREKPGKASQQ